MKIIQVHNYYQQAGGEDAVVEAERALLEEHGHQVVTFYKNNEAVGAGRWALVKASIKTVWNRETYSEFRKLLKSEKPDVVHCHNTFPLISPSIYWACAKEKVPVVQTLHNYRLLCLNAFLFKQNSSVKSEDLSVKQDRTTAGCRQPSANSPSPSAQRPVPGLSGSVCELCINKKLKVPGIRYRCYRDSLAASCVVALMLFIHKLIGTWSRKVAAYIALTEFQKQKMVEGGLPGDKIFVKPNFIDDSSMKKPLAISHQPLAQKQTPSTIIQQPSTDKKSYCLFVGRLSPEKGCDVLLKAWALFQQKLKANGCELSAIDQPQLLIVGDGPEREALEALVSGLQTSCSTPQTIQFLGRKPKTEVVSLMREAQFLVSPSVCYETFGLVALEAGMLNTPSIVAEPGAIAGLVNNRATGLLFPMGDEHLLAEKIAWAFEHSTEMKAMGAAALQAFASKYSAEVNYERLMDVYARALGVRH